jgi:uncharacterized protein with HEPN domain
LINPPYTRFDNSSAFRNILIHGYATVDDRLVWGVIEGSLPDLRTTLRTLLEGG